MRFEPRGESFRDRRDRYHRQHSPLPLFMRYGEWTEFAPNRHASRNAFFKGMFHNG